MVEQGAITALTTSYGSAFSGEVTLDPSIMAMIAWLAAQTTIRAGMYFFAICTGLLAASVVNTAFGWFIGSHLQPYVSTGGMQIISGVILIVSGVRGYYVFNAESKEATVYADKSLGRLVGLIFISEVCSGDKSQLAAISLSSTAGEHLVMVLIGTALGLFSAAGLWFYVTVIAKQRSPYSIGQGTMARFSTAVFLTIGLFLITGGVLSLG